MKASRYNTFVQRFGALLLDGIAFGIFYFLTDLLVDWKDIAWELVSSFLWICYSIFFHCRYGQTLGKMAMKIKVVDHRNEESLISFDKAVLRDAVHIVFFVLQLYFVVFGMYTSGIEGTFVLLSVCWTISELVTMWMNKKRRALHDLMGGSVVIDIATYSEWERKYYFGEKQSP